MQKIVKVFVDKYRLQSGIHARYIDLVSEVGELGKEILKGSEYGKRAYENTPNARSEIGDCLFSLFALCDEMNVDAEGALNDVLEKYESRFTQKGTISSESL